MYLRAVVLAGGQKAAVIKLDRTSIEDLGIVEGLTVIRDVDGLVGDCLDSRDDGQDSRESCKKLHDGGCNVMSMVGPIELSWMCFCCLKRRR